MWGTFPNVPGRCWARWETCPTVVRSGVMRRARESSPGLVRAHLSGRRLRVFGVLAGRFRGQQAQGVQHRWPKLVGDPTDVLDGGVGRQPVLRQANLPALQLGPDALVVVAVEAVGAEQFGEAALAPARMARKISSSSLTYKRATLALARESVGNRSPGRIAMISMATSSSIRVKPRIGL